MPCPCQSSEGGNITEKCVTLVTACRNKDLVTSVNAKYIMSAVDI